MVANGALVGCLLADDDMAAVGALPDAVALAREDHLVLDVLQQFAITLLVVFLNSADHLEFLRYLVKALCACFGCHACVHVRPLGVLAFSRSQQVGSCVADLAAVQVFVPYPCPDTS